ncbi:TPR end-of-group domain-containing protein [Luteolibacter soli]|uniref:Tetratricopeptide repeat protein n=1 Tax=Luteolibacter soli TaxID=3135280 RepID=A0ABU9APJ8_9BACT
MTDDIDAVCRRALGFLELGMPEDALADLDELTATNSIALHLRVDALFRLQRWQDASAICLPMTEQEPSDPGWWIQAAYAQRRASSIQEAEMILRAGLTRHPANALMFYNLACYSCVQQKIEEALRLLGKAVSIDPETMLAMARTDSDLEVLRPWILEQQAARRERSGAS